MPDLDCVCLPVSYFSITSELEHVNEGRRTKNYVIYYGYREFGLQLKDHLETANSPVRRLVRSVGNYYSSGMDHVTCSPEGFGLSYTNAPQLDLEKTGIAAADRHTNDDRSASVANEYYLSRIVEICRHHGVRLLLFTPPACRSYHERLCNSQLKRVVRTCEGLAKENEHIDYVNLLHSPVFAEDDFRDADHLNGEGAVKLTKILDQLLKR